MLGSVQATVAVLLVVAAGCGGDAQTAPETPATEIVTAPSRFLGKEVTVEARVSNPIDHRVWEMAGGRLFVIYDRGLDRGLEEGERLRVRGTVRPLERRVIEDDLGINIEDHFFDEAFLEDDVAVVAEDVTRL